MLHCFLSCQVSLHMYIILSICKSLRFCCQVFSLLFGNCFQDLEVIFSNIVEVAEFTANLLSSLEDALEMSDQSSSPCVGAVLEELAEVSYIYFSGFFAFQIVSMQAHEFVKLENRKFKQN